MNRRRGLMPTISLGRRAPWALGGVAAALAVIGLVQGDAGMVLLGLAAGAAMVFAFPIARLILGGGEDEEHSE